MAVGEPDEDIAQIGIGLDAVHLTGADQTGEAGPITTALVVSGTGSRLQTEPDVVFQDNTGTTVAVTDSKYKRLGTRPKSNDTYQILTAAHVLGCTRVSLTYPVAQDREPTTWRISSELGGPNIELTAIPLNLMSLARPAGPQGMIETIGAWLQRPVLL